MGEAQRKKLIAEALRNATVENIVAMAQKVNDFYASLATDSDNRNEVTAHEAARLLADQKHITLIGQWDGETHHYILSVLIGAFKRDLSFVVVDSALCASAATPAHPTHSLWRRLRPLTREGSLPDCLYRISLRYPQAPRKSRRCVAVDSGADAHQDATAPGARHAHGGTYLRFDHRRSRAGTRGNVCMPDFDVTQPGTSR
jgi:hypothetical protein